MSFLPFLVTLVLQGPPSEALIRKEAIDVNARLVEISGKLPPNDLYDYAFVMKYQAVGGTLHGQTLYVAHFNPRQARGEVKNEMKMWVGGTLRRFKEGDVHRMKLSPRVNDIWSNAVEDPYFDRDRKSARYWCLQVDKVD